MVNLSNNIPILAVCTIAVLIVVFGYNRAKPYGEIGILAWLQSLTLMTPWFVFFALLVTGIYINLIGVVALLVISATFYIYIGNLIRQKAQDKIGNSQTITDLAKKAIEESEKPVNLNKETSTDNQLEKTTTSENQNVTPEDNQNKKIFSVTVGQLPEDFVKIPDEDVSQIKTIFGIDTFFATETIPYQEGVIFKGNLRGDAEYTHQHLTERLTAKMAEKYRLFLVETPEEKPVVIVLPSKNDPQPLTLAQKNLALVLFLSTIFTTCEAIALLLGFDLVGQWNRYPEVLPLVTGLWIILIAHEIAHRVVGAKNNVKISLPFFLPSIQIGSFGAITRFESLIPNRSVLFDIAFAGPATGFVFSLFMLFLGLNLSTTATGLEIPTNFFQGSILVGILAKLFLQSNLEAQLTSIHPLAILGWLGLVITAINLLPAGQLDGGRIVQAIFGRKTCRRTTIGTLVILALVSLFNPINSLVFYWAIVILFLQRDLERPSLNELTEPNDTRAGLGLLLLLLALITIIPITPSLAARLGIGFSL